MTAEDFGGFILSLICVSLLIYMQIYVQISRSTFIFGSFLASFD